ncbi:MAG: hypothetical protein MJZ22_03305, partial [Candidatus Saccharibacteria bacterium]|nr:hypothetical protein [Candidatus Saccharibacteria bacterium]
MLFIICKDTKFQSNSQRECLALPFAYCCLSSAKIQNFKAIHNSGEYGSNFHRVVYHLQRYKISKQFTTGV